MRRSAAGVRCCSRCLRWSSILLTAVLRATHPPMGAWPSHVLGTFGFSVLIPLTALIIGTSVLGAEIDDGSIIHLLATPVRRSSVIVTKFAVATVLTMGFAAIPELVAGLISGGGTIPGKLVAGGRGSGHRRDAASVSGGKLALGLFAGALVVFGDLQRGVRHGVGGDHPRHRRRPAVRAGLGDADEPISSAGPGCSR